METPRAAAAPAFDLSLVVACYNEEGHLEGSVREIVRTMSATRYSYELIFIDDCSADGTRAILERIVADIPAARLVLHDHNVGRGGTVQEGFRLARGRVVGFLDIDLEVHCQYVPVMMQAIDDGYDGATAYRVYKIRLRPGHLLRHVLSRSYRLLLRASLDMPFRDTETGYKFFDRRAILPVLNQVEHEGWFWDTEIMVRAHMNGLRVLEIPCLFVQRSDKASTVRVFRDVLDYLVALVRFRRKLRAERPSR